MVRWFPSTFFCKTWPDTLIPSFRCCVVVVVACYFSSFFLRRLRSFFSTTKGGTWGTATAKPLRLDNALCRRCGVWWLIRDFQPFWRPVQTVLLHASLVFGSFWYDMYILYIHIYVYTYINMMNVMFFQICTYRCPQRRKLWRSLQDGSDQLSQVWPESLWIGYEILLMEEILHQVDMVNLNIPEFTMGFIHPRWCSRISSINSIWYWDGLFWKHHPDEFVCSHVVSSIYIHGRRTNGCARISALFQLVGSPGI